MKLGVANPAACSAYMLSLQNPGLFSDDDDDDYEEDTLVDVNPLKSGVRLRESLELDELEIDIVFDEIA